MISPYILARNGLFFCTHALIDSGANGFAFIDASFLNRLSPFLKPVLKRLKTPLRVKGYNGLNGADITHYTLLNLTVDDRIQSFTPFLITRLGTRTVILGRSWLAENRILLNCAQRKLHWPPDLPPTFSYAKNTEVLLRSSDRNTVDRYHQYDAARRDRKLDEYWSKQPSRPLRTTITSSANLTILRRPASPVHRTAEADCNSRELLSTPATSCTATFKKDTDAALRKMEKNLKSSLLPTPPAPKRRPKPLWQPKATRTPAAIEIRPISGTALNFICKNYADYELFSVTMQEVDSLLDQKREQKQGRDDLNSLVAQLLASTDRKAVMHSILNLEAAEPPVPDKYKDYAHVFSKAESNILPPHRPYDHKIQLEADGASSLRYSPLYKMSAEELETVKEYLTDNLAKGFIEPSQAPFAAPVLFVKKPNGSLRFCIDFRALNALTRKDRYPLPLIDETLACISSAKVFTKLDIRQAFHRIRMDPDSEEYTTFRTRYGAYKCKVMPFGLTNGPATYQRYMNNVLFDYLDVFCTAYLDDILIYSNNELEHTAQVRLVLQHLQEAGLQADLKKCEFDVTRTKYLGFIVSTDGIEVDPEKVAVVREWQYPTTVKGVQSFLGFCNFYRRFIRDFGLIAKPLINLTKAGTRFDFDENCQQAFCMLKEVLTSAPLLRHYDHTLPCMLETDASDGVVASVLSQKHGDDYFPVAYFSKTMQAAELNYEVHDKEMLAIVKSFANWRAELTSTPHQIRVYTDHKALEYFISTKSLNARQARWAELLADYHFLIAYRPGKQNPLADALTRKVDELDSQNKTKKEKRVQQLLKDDQLDPRIIAARMRTHFGESDLHLSELYTLASDIDLVARVLQANRDSKSLQPLRYRASSDRTEFSMQNGLLLYKDRLIVPDTANLRTLLIREVHDSVTTAHPGIRKTTLLLTAQYYWRGIAHDVATYVRNCHACRRSSVPRDKTPGLLHPLPIPTHAWEHITMDYCSFNQDKHGYDNILVIIDHLSKQAITIPCHKTIAAREQARLYLMHVYRYYGPPTTILSDRGPQFISSFWKEFNSILGTDIKLSTADHPQTDSQTEIYNQYLQKRLRPFVSYYQDDWSEYLPMMDYAQLTLPHSSLGDLPPFEVLYGYAPRTPWSWKQSDRPAVDDLNIDDARTYARRNREALEYARNAIQKSQERISKAVNKHRRPIDFDVGDYVWLDMRHLPTQRPSRKLDYPTNGRFKVLEKIGHSYRLELPDTMRIHDVFPADKLHKAADDPLPGQYNEPPPPINITGDDEYEVDKVLACRKRYKSLEYHVSWLNYDADLAWYKASDLKTAPHKLRDFHLENPTQPGPPALLPEWLRLFQDGEEDYDYADGDHPMTPAQKRTFLSSYR
jgi:transposase InsO family protein